VTGDDDGNAGRPAREQLRVAESGAIGDSVHLDGTYVGGRDVNVQHVHLESDQERPDRYMFQLPPDIGDFTGRNGDLARLRRLLRREPRDTPVVISAIAGKAGVGKTALATKVAHQLRSRFPDGQLYVNLRGAETQRLDPADVLGEFLLALGVPRAAIPDDLDERASRYRARLADRSVLVLLDNAVSEAQVRLLLPGSSSSAALITSRAKLTGLEGANFVTLEVLEAEEAIRLLAKIAGRKRVAAEAEAARRIVELCGYLPLAVRIAGAKLAAREYWPLRRLVERLTDERRRLAELTVGDLEVRASFALSYRGLTAAQQRTFRLLGLLEAPDFPSWVAGAMLDEDPSDAEELVDKLVEAHVLEVAKKAGDTGVAAPPDPATEPFGTRYRFHDLLRVFARERLLDDPAQERETALRQALRVYLVVASQAAARVDPARRLREAGEPVEPEPLGQRFHVPERLLDNPVAWLAMERTSLIAAVEQAHERGFWELCWRLAASLAYLCDLHNHWTDWQHTQELALEASRQAGNRHAEANGLRSLGTVHLRQMGSEPLGETRLEQAIAHFEQCLPIFRELKDRRGEAQTLHDLANAYVEQSRIDKAMWSLRRCKVLFDKAQDPSGQAWTTFSFGLVHRIQGRYERAMGCFQESLAAMKAIRDRHGEGYALVNIGVVLRDQKNHEPALEMFREAVAIFEEQGDRDGQTWCLINAGHVYRDLGLLPQALDLLSRGLDSFRGVDDRMGQAWTLVNIGQVHREQGHLCDALVALAESLKLFQDLRDKRGKAWVFVSLGDVRRLQDQPNKALRYLNRALLVLRSFELRERLWEAKALSSRGRVLADRGQRPDAEADWREALTIFTALATSEAAQVQEWLEAGDHNGGPA
jgi:tetratricopeptide (TPR) repeat protein